MSGRSAVARAKREATSRDLDVDGFVRYQKPYQLLKIVRELPPIHTDVESISISSHDGSIGANLFGPVNKPTQALSSPYQTMHYKEARKPLVIPSAIERSGIRTQMDNFTDNIRGNLGKLIGVGRNRTTSGSIRPESRGQALNVESRSAKASTNVPSLVHSSTSAPTASVLTYQSSRRAPTNRSRLINRRSSWASPSTISSGLYEESSRRDCSLFTGAGNERDWRSLRSREAFSSTVDTLVHLRAPNGKFHILSSFYVDSRKLSEFGCSKLLRLMEDNNDLYDRVFAEIAPIDGMSFTTSHLNGAADDVSVVNPLSDYHIEESVSLPDSQPGHELSSKEIKYVMRIDCKPGPDDEDGNGGLLNIRNFLSMIHDVNRLCGNTLFETLSGLVQKVFREDGYLDLVENKKGFLTNFLMRHRYDDVRNSYSHALSLLAFSELREIRWREGFIEGLVHSTGMWNAGCSLTPDWHFLEPTTQLLLQSSARAMGKKLAHAEGYFATFDFSDMWSWSAAAPLRGCARASYERFRHWLHAYLSDRDSGFLDAKANKDWLTQERLQMLKDVFHSLYDYLVDREAMIQGGDGSGMPYTIMNVSDPSFQADLGPEIPFTDLINSWDDVNSFPRIPHPYPLLPRAVLGTRKPRILPMRPTAAEQEHLQEKAQSYMHASNLSKLGSDSRLDSVIADFNMFEQEDEIRTINLRDARLGRWTLVYGALQILATVDSPPPSVKYLNHISYHVTVPLKCALPWTRRGSELILGPRHEDSHPFTVPETWPTLLPRKDSLSSPISDYGQSLIRVDHEIKIHRPSTRGHDDSDQEKKHETLISASSLSNLRRSNTISIDWNGAMIRSGGRGGLVSEGLEFEDPAVKVRKEIQATRAKQAPPIVGRSNWRGEPGW